MVDRDDGVVARVRADLYRLRPIDRKEDWSFAQVLVSYRPSEFVLTSFKFYKMPAGARRRLKNEPESAIEPIELTRAPQVAMAIYLAVILLTSVIGAVLRP